MTVLIDADGCPVVDITVKLCRKYNTQCLIICDTAHEFQRDGAQTIVLDKGADSVDYGLVNRAQSGDLVVTQDYGLASMCLAKSARVLHQDGWEYTVWNIDGLMHQRHTARKLRSSHVHMKGPKKRQPSQDAAFTSALEAILQTAVQG